MKIRSAAVEEISDLQRLFAQLNDLMANYQQSSFRLVVRARNLDYVELSVLPENRRAAVPYRRSGYQDVLHRLRLNVKIYIVIYRII